MAELRAVRRPCDRPLLDPVTLHERAAAQAGPEWRLDIITLDVHDGRAVSYWVTPLTDPATGESYASAPREVYVNPYTGEIVSRRENEQPIWPVTGENFLYVVVRLHYQLATPGNVGTWLFGVASLVWTIDCFVGAYLTFPLRRRNAGGANKGWLARWRPSWFVRLGRGWFRFNFDLHRAGGLWIWAMLFVFAWTGVGLNLREQVYQPVMNALFDMRPMGEEIAPLPAPLEHAELSERDALARARGLAREKASELGFEIGDERELGFDRDSGVYAYRFASSANIADDDAATILFDANTGKCRSIALPDRERFGVRVESWLFALHFAGVWGLPMRIFVCFAGILVAALSVSGVVIWWRKRSARVKAARKERGRARAAALRRPEPEPGPTA